MSFEASLCRQCDADDLRLERQLMPCLGLCHRAPSSPPARHGNDHDDHNNGDNDNENENAPIVLTISPLHELNNWLKITIQAPVRFLTLATVYLIMVYIIVWRMTRDVIPLACTTTSVWLTTTRASHVHIDGELVDDAVRVTCMRYMTWTTTVMPQQTFGVNASISMCMHHLDHPTVTCNDTATSSLLSTARAQWLNYTDTCYVHTATGALYEPNFFWMGTRLPSEALHYYVKLITLTVMLLLSCALCQWYTHYIDGAYNAKIRDTRLYRHAYHVSVIPTWLHGIHQVMNNDRYRWRRSVTDQRGASSSSLQTFVTSPIYDRQLIRLIASFVDDNISAVATPAYHPYRPSPANNTNNANANDHDDGDDDDDNNPNRDNSNEHEMLLLPLSSRSGTRMDGIAVHQRDHDHDDV